MQSEVTREERALMTQSQHFPRKLEPPTHSGSDLLPHEMVASELSEGLNGVRPS